MYFLFLLVLALRPTVYVDPRPAYRSPAARRVVQETRSWYGGMAEKPSRWRLYVARTVQAVGLVAGVATVLLAMGLQDVRL